MKSLKESLLDDEEEIIDKLDWRDKFPIPEIGDIVSPPSCIPPKI